MNKSTNPQKIERTAILAAKRAAKIQLSYYQRKTFGIRFKGDVNLVTDADTKSEKAVIQTIKKAFPDHQILSEENQDSHQESLVGPVWIIDPLDGTTNFSHRLPFFSISIAYRENNQTVFGLIYQPVLKELFIAHRGKGAKLNGKKILVSNIREIGRSLLATGFPYDRRDTSDNNLREFSIMEMNCQDLRRPGAATLDLAYVACGRYEGFWEHRLAAWDIAAGILLVTEAGGKVTDFAGNPFTNLWRGEIMVSNGIIHDRFVELMARAKKS